MSIAIKRLERAIGDLPKGGMQTGNHKVKLDLADAERLIVELNALQAEHDAALAHIGFMKEELRCLSVNLLAGASIDELGDMLDQTITDSDRPHQHHLAAHDAEVAKAAIYALFEAGNCPQLENGAGDGYIECGDALKFAEQYAAQLRAKAGE